MEKYNKLIDHTLLKPDASYEAIEKLCEEARKYDFASVCINPHFVAHCAQLLKGSDVKVCTVIGFPLGQNTVDTKVFEAKNAFKNGADEIDMVINISNLKAKKYDLIYQEIALLKEVAGSHILKVILETCLLTDEEKVRACEIALKAGADYVKTSTGFSSGGATLHDVALMKKVVGEKAKVKASGGVRNFDDLKAYVAAGASRIGTSSGVKIMEGLTSHEAY